MADENVICPYCKNPAEWVENKKIYGRNYGKSFMMWYCRPCDAYVGCHNNTKKPLGIMANAELRAWRITAHNHIDPVWKSGLMKRKELYRRLSEKLGRELHIGECTIEQCKEILKIDMSIYIL